MRGHLVDIVSDEVIADSPDGVSALNAAIDALARRVAEGVDRVAQPPVSFRGVAGLRLFRDEIFGGLGFVFQADDRYYRKHGLYDFPQRRYGRRLQSAFMTLLTKIPGLRQEIRNRLQGELVKPYRKVVAAVDDS